MNKKLIFAIVAGAALLGTEAWLYAGARLQTASRVAPALISQHSAIAPLLATTPTIASPQATPTLITINTPTTVTVTAQIMDPSLIDNGANLLRLNPTGTSTILGVLHDDGLNGDAVGGDKIFSIRLNFSEAAAGQIRLQVSAAFRGLLRRITSSTINVDAWPSYSASALNFSILYPPTWSVSSPQNTGTIGVVTLIPPNVPQPDYGGDITILSWPNPTGLTIQQFFDGDPATDLYTDATNGFQAVTVAERPAVLFRNVVGADTGNVVVVQNSNRFLEIQFAGTVGQSVIDNVLGSLRLLP